MPEILTAWPIFFVHIVRFQAISCIRIVATLLDVSNKMCYPILARAERSAHSIHTLERYRSGHNGADSKSVCVKAHVGSNPTLSAQQGSHHELLVGFLLSKHLIWMARVSKARQPLPGSFSAMLHPICWVINKLSPQQLALA